MIHRGSQVDKDALEVLCTRYQTLGYSLAMLMLKQPALAEDVTQEIFLNIWLKAGRFNLEHGQPQD